MAAKAILVLCAQALLVQSALSQCFGRAGFGDYDGLALGGAGYGGIGYGYGAGLGSLGDIGSGAEFGGLGIGASSGGSLPVTTASPIAPSGLSVASENIIEGPLAVAGELPFISAVALEGRFPTAGAGSVNYGCGSGAIGITSAGIGGVDGWGRGGVDGWGRGGVDGWGLGAGGVGALAGRGAGWGALGGDISLGVGAGRLGCGCGRGLY